MIKLIIIQGKLGYFINIKFVICPVIIMGTKLKILLLYSVISLLASCTKYYEERIDPEKEVFNFTVTDNQANIIHTSRGLQYLVTHPVPVLNFSGKSYSVDKFEIRGESTLNFNRKSFGVNMSTKIPLYNFFVQEVNKYGEFKLLSMVYDYTYIEHSITEGFLRKLELWPVFTFFTELKLNDQSEGLFHFVEDPVEYFVKKEDASIVIRRGYDHVIKTYKSAAGFDPAPAISKFRKIYSVIAQYTGKQLYDTLSVYMDLKQYFKILSVDMLVKNGDYTDEVFFYSKKFDGRLLFGVCPWDFDDIFSDSPHEIGNSWATGTVFGHRKYDKMSDIITAVGSKLLFSVEDDLDYKIATDSYLYQQYLKVLNDAVTQFNDQFIDEVLDFTYDHISPFYSNPDIIAQSKYDQKETSYDLFINNIAVKRQLLKERRNFIVNELNNQLER
jgi:spore coat protein H